MTEKMWTCGLMSISTCNYPIVEVMLLDDMEEEPDSVMLCSPECLEAVEKYDARIKVPEDPSLN